MEHKPLHNDYCIPPADPLAPTIFHEGWWLGIVTGGNYGVVESTINGELVGRLPYFLKKKCGLSYSLMPPMTHFLGPAIIQSAGQPATQFLRRATIIHDLLSKLPNASIYRYKCHRDISDVIAFQQKGFLTNVQFTYEILPQPLDVLWGNMRSKKRKKIRAAGNHLAVSILNDTNEFWEFYDRNLHKKNIKNLCNKAICFPLIEECLRKKRGCIYAARDKNNQLVAAIFCIWDATTSFYFMSSRIDAAHDGAISLLTWEAMKDAAHHGLIFDFDGLNSASSVLFFTEFGGTISPRYIVTKQTLLGGIALDVKEHSRASKFFY